MIIIKLKISEYDVTMKCDFPNPSHSFPSVKKGQPKEKTPYSQGALAQNLILGLISLVIVF